MNAILHRINQNRPKSRGSAQNVAGTGADVFFIQDTRGTITAVSGASWQLFSAGPQRLKGLHLTDLTAARSHPALLGALMQAMRDGEATVVVDLKPTASAPHASLLLKAQAGGGFECALTPLSDRSQAPIPHTERPRQELLPAAPDQLADVSHEIRTPLNAVIGFADALRQESFGPLGDRRYRDYAKLIQESGQHVLALVNDLLDLSKAEANRLTVEPQSVDVEAEIAACAGMLRLEAENAGLSLSMKTAPGLGFHKLDPKILRQILINLLSNALKFTDRGGITVRSRILDGRLVISVEDTGVGMSEDDLRRVGERFYQARSAGVRGARGSGLGLALSHALAKAHGGRLDIRSSPGRGTTATLTLPLADVTQVPSGRPQRRYRPLAEPRRYVALEPHSRRA
ncbi:MAG: HAMP domain-containing sensor histidine kinase [Pseudomonadota bacterium]